MVEGEMGTELVQISQAFDVAHIIKEKETGNLLVINSTLFTIPSSLMQPLMTVRVQLSLSGDKDLRNQWERDLVTLQRRHSCITLLRLLLMSHPLN